MKANYDHHHDPFHTSLADFLQQSRLDTSHHFVIGNQAGDADSIISALTLAYIDSMASASASASASSAATSSSDQANGPVPVVPIVSVAQNDFKFRQETVRLLELAGVVNAESNLHFVDQLDSKLLQENNTTTECHKETSVILVDHNRLDATYEQRYHWKVVEMLDHHHDEGMHPNVRYPHRNVAYQNNNALVASTCTLVTERLLSSYRNNHQLLLPPPFPADLAIALLGVIVLDTLNMSPEAGKGTPRDQQAIDALLEHTNWTKLLSNNNGGSLALPMQKILSDHAGTVRRPDLCQLFDVLQSAKFDPSFWKSLSVVDALRLDYKQFNASSGQHQQEQQQHVVFGVSTVLMPMDDFLSKDDLWQSILNYMNEQSIVILGVMTAATNQDGNLERELLLCSLQQEAGLLTSLADFLAKSSTLALEEVPLGVRDPTNQNKDVVVVRQFRQGNAKASRKQVVPIMMQFFQTMT